MTGIGRQTEILLTTMSGIVLTLTTLAVGEIECPPILRLLVSKQKSFPTDKARIVYGIALAV
jgi:hypothetical protein